MQRQRRRFCNPKFLDFINHKTSGRPLSNFVQLSLSSMSSLTMTRYILANNRYRQSKLSSVFTPESDSNFLNIFQSGGPWSDVLWGNKMIPPTTAKKRWVGKKRNQFCITECGSANTARRSKERIIS